MGGDNLNLFQGGRAGAVGIFFGHVSILFHECNNKNIIYQQFLLFTLYILHIVHIDLILLKSNFW